MEITPYDRVLGIVDNYKVVSLFPYQIKDASLFIHRDHVPYIEGDQESADYARDVYRRITEGLWVNDNGTWVWMPPKMYYYVNMGTIEHNVDGGKDRKPMYPEPWDNVWIPATYIACCDGFSGFIGDEEVTCNIKIKEIVDGDELPPRVLEKLERTCRKPDGTWKTYMNAWDYLTVGYLLQFPRDKPLGAALYENDSYNGFWLGARGVGKTNFLAAGDAAQELQVDGAMSYEALREGRKVNMMLGASDSKFIKTFMEAMRVSFTGTPGGDKGSHGHFTKTASNDWDGDKGVVELVYRKADGTFGGSRSSIGKAVIPINNPGVVVSTRSKRIYIDEIGLLPNAKAVFEAGRNTLRSPSGKFGGLMGSGTGGHVDKIAETKAIYYATDEYEVYALPNYWVDNMPIGLFTPKSYAMADWKDPQGNTDLMAATRAVIKERLTKSKGDKGKITEMRMNEPLDPTEIFLAGKSDAFMKDVIVDRISILQHGEFKKKARIYDLELGPPTNDPTLPTYEVYAHERKATDTDWENVVLDFHRQQGKTGELVVFEPPMGDGREFLEYNNLYKVTYDPKTDIETGESFGSIKVWKGKPQRGLFENEMFYNIVATAKVKRDNHELALLLCLWYKAKMQYERNVSGIPDFFNKYSLGWLLQPTPIAYIRDVSPTSKQSQQSGIIMTDPLKRDAMRAFKKFHKSTVHVDGIGRKFSNVETWWDLSLLHEMNFYDDINNFDDISAMLVLMLWLEAEYMPENSANHDNEAANETAWEDLAGTARKLMSR